MSFPYISQIVVHNCFTHQNFSIPHEPLGTYKHIIMTGKNGSGKTTILNRIGLILSTLSRGKAIHEEIAGLKGTIQANQTHANRPEWEKMISELNDVDLIFVEDSDQTTLKNPNEYIHSFFKAHRKVEFQDVTTVTKETDFIKELNKPSQADITAKFKQYLVNRKVYEAFDYINSNEERIKQSAEFFKNITETLRSIFKDDGLELKFVQENFEFYLNLSDGRSITFSQLSEGFSAFLSILMDLFIRVDLLRKIKSDYSIDPCGIVLIDEPETHFHLSMQYEILPLLSRLFPKIQFVIATHSPAVISSLKNAIVYDLSSKQEVADWLLGSSYSELMISHFGLENEFSPVADKILADADHAIKQGNYDALRNLIIQNDKFLTPSLRLELESQMIQIKSKEAL